MRPELRILALVGVALAAVAIPVLLVERSLPPRVESEIVASAPGTARPVPLELRGGLQRLAVDTPRFSDARETRVQVVVATYGRPASETVRLVLRNGRGAMLGACSVTPSAYAATGHVECPVAQPAQIRSVLVTAPAGAPLAVRAVDDGGHLVAGALVRDHRYSGLGARVRALADRIGVTRPALAAPELLFVLLVASFALFGAAWIVAAGRQ
jgi:hypothetical protein